MAVLILFATIVAALAVVDVLALRYGTDSRRLTTDRFISGASALR